MENPFKKVQIQPRKSKINSERASIIAEFVEEINKERIGTRWKPASPRAIAMKVSHLKTNHDLYFLLSKCKKAKSFGACFFGELKLK